MSIYKENIKKAVEVMRYAARIKPDPLDQVSPEVRRAVESIRLAAGLDKVAKPVNKTSSNLTHDSSS